MGQGETLCPRLHGNPRRRLRVEMGPLFAGLTLLVGAFRDQQIGVPGQIHGVFAVAVSVSYQPFVPRKMTFMLQPQQGVLVAVF